jgi:hypothetical protein
MICGSPGASSPKLGQGERRHTVGLDTHAALEGRRLAQLEHILDFRLQRPPEVLLQ